MGSKVTSNIKPVAYKAKRLFFFRPKEDPSSQLSPDVIWS